MLCTIEYFKNPYNVPKTWHKVYQFDPEHPVIMEIWEISKTLEFRQFSFITMETTLIKISA